MGKPKTAEYANLLDEARALCGEALGYVQAGQGDPVLYRMLHDLKTILDKADH